MVDQVQKFPLVGHEDPIQRDQGANVVGALILGKLAGEKPQNLGVDKVTAPPDYSNYSHKADEISALTGRRKAKVGPRI